MKRGADIDYACEVAEGILRKSHVRGYGVVAGGHYRQVWTRDFCFASLGYMELGMHDKVKETLLQLISMQREDGQIPLRIGHNRLELLLVITGFHIPEKRTAIYCEDKENNLPADPNSLLIIAFHNYIKKTNDCSFLNDCIAKLEKAILWNLSRDIDNDLLMEEGPFATWADNVRKQGKVLYTNVCHCRALKCMSELQSLSGENTKSLEHQELFDRTKEAIDRKFWNGSFYEDWIHGDYRTTHFTSDGNLLASLWDIADTYKSKKIQEEVNSRMISKGVPSMTNAPLFEGKHCSTFWLDTAGMRPYHNGRCWTWLGAIDAAAKNKLGLHKEAMEVLSCIAGYVKRDGTFHEVYNPDGTLFKTWFYRNNPKDFTWSAGLYAWVYFKIKNEAPATITLPILTGA